MKEVLPSELLPHRPPFLMVDRIVSMGNGKASGIKQITGDFLSYNGYFPQVLVIEALAQISGIAAGIKGQGMLVGIKDIIFHKEVEHGDILSLDSTIDGRFGNMFCFSVSAYVDKDKIVEGTLYLSIHG